ncbi:MAG: AEC family transporter [Lachnospiraceae bacterium]
MNNIALAVNVVFPLFCMMTLGYGLKKVKVLNKEFLRQLNSLCFKVFLPMVLFINIYQSDFFELFSIKLVLFAVAIVLLSFMVLYFIVPKIEPKNMNRGVMIQGIFRSNYILFGVPIAQGLYGEGNTGVTAILIAFIIPLFNLLSVVALSFFSKQKQTKKQTLLEIAHNPLIIASIIAVCFKVFHISLPPVMEQTISDLGKVATPLALITLGGSFQFQSLGKYKAQLCVSVLGKLIIVPGICILLSIFAGFRGVELAALMAMFASPTAVSSFTMAQNSNANYELAGQIVVFDSLLSVLTISIWIILLKQFSMI